MLCDFLYDSKILDIKNSDHPRACYLMVPQAQFNRHRPDIYIGATTTFTEAGAVVVLHGWIERRMFGINAELAYLKISTYRYRLNQLTPMDELL